MTSIAMNFKGLEPYQTYNLENQELLDRYSLPADHAIRQKSLMENRLKIIDQPHPQLLEKL